MAHPSRLVGGALYAEPDVAGTTVTLGSGQCSNRRTPSERCWNVRGRCPPRLWSGLLVAQCPCGSSRPCGNARAPGTALDTRGRQWNTSSVCSAASARGQGCQVRLPLDTERHRRWPDLFIVGIAHGDGDTIVGVADHFLVVLANGLATS